MTRQAWNAEAMATGHADRSDDDYAYRLPIGAPGRVHGQHRASGGRLQCVREDGDDALSRLRLAQGVDAARLPVNTTQPPTATVIGEIIPGRLYQSGIASPADVQSGRFSAVVDLTLPEENPPPRGLASRYRQPVAHLTA